MATGVRGGRRMAVGDEYLLSILVAVRNLVSGGDNNVAAGGSRL